jgi:histidyl-tRNA synthetase
MNHDFADVLVRKQLAQLQSSAATILFSSMSVQSVIAIGQGRRLTLTELYLVSLSSSEASALLQWHEPSDSSSDHPVSLDTLVLEDIDDDVSLLSVEETRSVMTILAFQLVQTEGNTSIAARKLVQLLNGASRSSIPSALDSAMQFLQKCIPELAPSTRIVQRSFELGTVALSVYQATLLSTSAALPIAALSVDASGLAPQILQEHWYTELAFDTLRPHRSMVSAAATLRAILNESRYGIAKEDSVKDSEAERVALVRQALCDIPQYHGPATEQLSLVSKQLELEVNCRAVEATQISLDPTLLDLCISRAKSAVTLQLLKSAQRLGNSYSNDLDTMSLSKLVVSWEASLSTEACKAIKHIQEVTAAVSNDAMKKEAEREAKAAPSVENTGVDEFAGKSEAAIAKILKIRKEKEEKAAAKRKAKEQKGVSLFGAGTQVLCQVLTPFVNDSLGNIELFSSSSKEPLMQQLSTTVEKLLSGGLQRKPKIPKGTRDYLPDQMIIRQQAFSIIRRVFESHGAVEIDTPVFELKDTLTGKYGEDSKLIYDLADQGGELLALRYDLTVPFARFLALNNVGNIKRFHIGKVYRRDQPALKRGRYREFYQCDFDIAGVYGRMVPDSECLCVVCDILDALPIGDFAIKVNHRCLLDAILDICGVPADKFRTICSAVDKLDKEPWSEVKREMVEDKGLQEHVADKIGEFVLKKGPPIELYNELMDTKRFGDHKGASQAMEDLRILFDYLEAFDKLKFMSFDLSLARGLDYYTGVIYEAVCMSGTSQVGSIGGGGRYDNLVSMFQEAGKQTPCVGVSVGIERVFTLMEARMREENNGSIQQPNVTVLIASAGGAMMKEKMKIARILWNASISAEFSQQENAKLKKEVVNALDRNIPFMVVIGESELAENKCQVKDIKANSAEVVSISDLVPTLRKKGAIPVGCEFAHELLKAEG